LTLSSVASDPFPPARGRHDQGADATLAKDASSNDGFLPGIRIMPDAENPDATEASHPGGS
jgi:hypothetical protein